MKLTEERNVALCARRARKAARRLATLSDTCRRQALLAAADALFEQRATILAANEQDCQQALSAVENGSMTPAMLARLRTSARGVEEMALRMHEVADLPDVVGRTLSITELDQGLTLHKVSCPLGVIGIVFESRPDVVPQVAALALKSGNALLLKGGAEAAQTNEALVSILRASFSSFSEIPEDAINLLHTREDVIELLALEDEIDLIIPRGSKQFVRYVANHSRIPVLGHGEGLCHVYIDVSADLEKGYDIAFDSKVQYPAACNAAETLLVHKAVATKFLPEMIDRFTSAGVEVRGCPSTLLLLDGRNVSAAFRDDWTTEYSDLKISIKIVGSIDEAITHIERYGSKHTEVIVTEDEQAASRFMEEVDAASVFHNASTRFADGFRYGLGAELGISTSKLHARGPVGLEALVTYKYKLYGEGHTVKPYAEGARKFKHRAIE
jgi:glutamate-5-semialdehyde dehydrogenase